MSAVPAEIGRYRIDGLLGEGAMGVVYRAWDTAIDRPVAIKLIRADLLATEARADYLLRFRREAQAAGRCTHANIVALHDVSTDAAGNPFLVMEYVEGTSLDRILARGTTFGPAQAAEIGVQILDALACAHGFGVVHRDIKPANILLLDCGRVKVTDFGISRLVSSDMTQIGSVIGTPSYMSPEQCMGDEAGPQSDLFSVASVLFELLSGHKAFTGNSIGRIALQLTQDALPPIPGLPPPLQAVIDRAHAKRPEARFASAGAMADALRATLATPAVAPTETVIFGAPTPPAAGLLLDPATARTIETLFSRAVGPIARHLLQRAQAQAGSAEALVQSLAAGIDDPAQRSDFMRAANGALRGTASGIALAGASQASAPPAPAPATIVPADACDRIARELTRHVGPIATILVRRAATSATSVAQLRAALAAHITDEAERAAFLQGR